MIAQVVQQMACARTHCQQALGRLWPFLCKRSPGACVAVAEARHVGHAARSSDSPSQHPEDSTASGWAHSPGASAPQTRLHRLRKGAGPKGFSFARQKARPFAREATSGSVTVAQIEKGAVPDRSLTVESNLSQHDHR